MRRIGWGLAGLLFLAMALMAKDQGSDVDSGSFGIFANGKRVASETFSIHQTGGGSTISSQIKDGDGTALQSSELQLTAAGALVRYEWHEHSPGKGTLTVVPDNEFLRETITAKPGDKPAEQPLLLPTTSPILDNNFFVHREILAWRYMSASCTPEATGLKCGPGDFGVVVPQDRSSYHLTIQPIGDEKVQIHGLEQTLLHLNLKGEDGEWSLWVNTKDHYKLMRVTKAGEQVEIVRD
jgi:hypothetical protein